MADTEDVHRSGLVNPNWPLCVEVDALSRGWGRAEVEDGELVDDPMISGDGAAEWFTPRPVSCQGCRELAHA